MRKILLFAVCVLNILFVKLNAQVGMPTTIPTPNSNSIISSGDIGMSLYTGSANISVPIFSTTLRNIPLEINLQYNTSGILVNDLPSWTGHSWTLCAGGVITRTVKGERDEHDKWINFYDEDFTEHWDNYFHRYDDICTDSVLCGDYMADIFNFNFMGKSGKFFLGNDGQWKVSCDENLTVIFDINNDSNYIYPLFEDYPCANIGDRKQPKTIKGFTIFDSNGNKYVFGGDRSKEASEYSINMFDGNTGNWHGAWYADSWYLTDVYDRYGNNIYSFMYTRGLFLVSSALCYTQTMPIFRINSPVYLKKITMRDGTSIVFDQDHTMILSSHDFYHRLYAYYDSTSDLFENLKKHENHKSNDNHFVYLCSNDYSQYQNPNNTNKSIDPLASMGMSPLKNIMIRKNGMIYKKYQLNYNYASNIRLHLGNVTIYDGSNDCLGSYQFTYSDFNKLPTVLGHSDYLTDACDHWGYCNKYTTSLSSLPENMYNYACNYVANEKNVNIACSKYGMMTEIQYPTGGVTEIEYANNRYSKYRNCYHRLVQVQANSSDDFYETSPVCYGGGLVVSALRSYEDSTKTKLLSDREFTYHKGQLSCKPYYTMEATAPEDVKVSGYSIVNNVNSSGSSVGYSHVTENNADSIEKQYYFTNFNNYSEHSCWNNLGLLHDSLPFYDSAQDCFAAFDEWSSKDYRRGKLYYMTIKNRNGYIYKKTIQYRNDEDNLDNTNVRCAMTPAKSAYGHTFSSTTVWPIYYIYYGKYDIASEVIETRMGNDWVVDSVIYNYQDYTKNIIDEYGHTQTGEARLCTSINTKRKDNVHSINYDYSVDNNIFANEWFFPLTSEMQYYNGQFVKGTMMEYSLFNSGTNQHYAPSCEKVYSGDVNTPTIVKQYTQYSNNFLPVTLYDVNNCRIKLVWDNYDHLLSHEVGNTIVTSCTYNRRGLQISKTAPNSYIEHYEYDANNRLLNIKDNNMNIKESYRYNYKSGL